MATKGRKKGYKTEAEWQKTYQHYLKVWDRANQTKYGFNLLHERYGEYNESTGQWEVNNEFKRRFAALKSTNPNNIVERLVQTQRRGNYTQENYNAAGRSLAGRGQKAMVNKIKSIRRKLEQGPGSKGYDDALMEWTKMTEDKGFGLFVGRYLGIDNTEAWPMEMSRVFFEESDGSTVDYTDGTKKEWSINQWDFAQLLHQYCENNNIEDTYSNREIARNYYEDMLY